MVYVKTYLKENTKKSENELKFMTINQILFIKYLIKSYTFIFSVRL